MGWTIVVIICFTCMHRTILVFHCQVSKNVEEFTSQSESSYINVKKGIDAFIRLLHMIRLPTFLDYSKLHTVRKEIIDYYKILKIK